MPPIGAAVGCVVVALHIGGQLHGQVRDMPEGTVVSGFTVDDEPEPKRRLFGRRKRG